MFANDSIKLVAHSTIQQTLGKNSIGTRPTIPTTARKISGTSAQMSQISMPLTTSVKSTTRSPSLAESLGSTLGTMRTTSRNPLFRSAMVHRSIAPTALALRIRRIGRTRRMVRSDRSSIKFVRSTDCIKLLRQVGRR